MSTKTLTLYRGDAEKIGNFRMTRANPSSLYGQGIYLTDTLDVAKTYRKKGSFSGRPDGNQIKVLYHSPCELPRGELVARAFKAYFKRCWTQAKGVALPAEHSTDWAEFSKKNPPRVDSFIARRST